jgi:hypothetical protein
MENLLSQLPLDAIILNRTPPEVVEFLLRLLAENQALKEENQLFRQEIVLLRARVEKLEAKLNGNFLNPNKPPPSDFSLVAKPRHDPARKL